MQDKEESTRVNNALSYGCTASFFTSRNGSSVSIINGDGGFFTTFYQLESHPSVHGEMSGKQSALQGGESQINTVTDYTNQLTG